MQRGIRHFFQQKSQPKPATHSCIAQDHSEAQAADQPQAQGPKSAVQQFTRKRRRTEEPRSEAEAPAAPITLLAAAVGGAAGSRPAAAPAAAAAPSGLRRLNNGGCGSDGGGGSGRQLTQMFLDAGQHDFHLSRCAVCGLVYAKGEESDEKAHAAYHTSATKGLRYQLLPGERTLIAGGGGGRVVLLSLTGAACRSKKLQELCTFLEDQMGLVKGWLLSVPASIYLYVSPDKRVLGCVVAEGVKEAFPAVPQLGAAALAQLGSHGSEAQQASWQLPTQGASPLDALRHTADAMAVLTRPATSVTFSSRTACTAAAAAAGRPPCEPEAGCQDSNPLALTTSSQDSRGGPVAAASEEGERCADGSPEQATGVPSESASAKRQHSGPQSPQPQAQDRLPTSGEGGKGSLSAQRRGGAGGQQSSGGCAEPGAQRQQQQQACSQGPQPASPASARPASTVLAIDRSQRVRAVCGIRLVWVSVEARRQGLATRMLDCVRSHFVPGYVVLRHELAFTQPSDQGRALIEAYVSTKEFLVY